MNIEYDFPGLLVDGQSAWSSVLSWSQMPLACPKPRLHQIPKDHRWKAPEKLPKQGQKGAKDYEKGEHVQGVVLKTHGLLREFNAYYLHKTQNWEPDGASDHCDRYTVTYYVSRAVTSAEKFSRINLEKMKHELAVAGGIRAGQSRTLCTQNVFIAVFPPLEIVCPMRAVPCRNGLADSRSTGKVQQPLNSIDQCFSMISFSYLISLLASSYRFLPFPSSIVSVLVPLCSVSSLCSEKMTENLQTGGALPQADFF